jgi:hypothetical protein
VVAWHHTNLPGECPDLGAAEGVDVGIAETNMDDPLKFEGYSEWLEIYSDVLLVESLKKLDVLRLRLFI